MNNLLFLPVYNCSSYISKLINDLKKHNLKEISEILIIDNKSLDNTVSTVIESIKKIDLDKKITFIQNDENVNLGGTHKVALNYAKLKNFDYAIIFHGDYQGSLADVEQIINQKKYYTFDFYLGSRFMKGSKLVNYSRLRIIGNYFFNFLFSLIAGKKISDLGSGLNVFKIKEVDFDIINGFPNTLLFNYHLILYIIHFKKKYCFFPLHWSESDQISNVKYISHVVGMCKILLSYFFNKTNFFVKEIYKYTYKIIYEK